MKLGFVSDAHGNSEGLRLCLEELRNTGAERIYFLGDAVGYLPEVDQVVAMLKRERVLCQKGNHEAMLLGELALAPERDRVYRLDAARSRLSREQFDWLGEWPDHRVLVLNDSRLLLVHGSPQDHLRDYVCPDSDLSKFGTLTYDVVFMGHTHRPFQKRHGRTLFVNVGSCGLPRDQNDMLGCALYDSTNGTCEILLIPFDRGSLRRRLRQHEVAPEVLRSFDKRSFDAMGTKSPRRTP